MEEQSDIRRKEKKKLSKFRAEDAVALASRIGRLSGVSGFIVAFEQRRQEQSESK